MPSQPSRLIAPGRAHPDARLRLFCLPFAGGGATVFRSWSAGLPAWIEVCPIQLPGRETRMREPLFDQVEPLADELADGLEPWFDKPFAIFGHSMGALIGFELARRLRARGNPHLRTLFASARSAPQIALAAEDRLYDLPEATFVDRLRRLNGTPESILQNPELWALFGPLLRADLKLNEAYRYTDGPPLDIPITAFGGLSDERVRQADVAAWSAQTSGGFRLHMLQGDHFFLNTCQPALFALISDDLQARLNQEHAPPARSAP